MICGFRRKKNLLIWGRSAVQPRTEPLTSVLTHSQITDFHHHKSFFDSAHVFVLSAQTSEGIYLQKEQKTSFLLQTERARTGDMTFLDSKDRVCFLLRPSIVPGAAAAAAAVVLRGEPPTAGQQQPIRGRDGETEASPRSHRTKKTAKEGTSNSLQASSMALLPSTGGCGVLLQNKIHGPHLKTI